MSIQSKSNSKIQHKFHALQHWLHYLQKWKPVSLLLLILGGKLSQPCSNSHTELPFAEPVHTMERWCWLSRQMWTCMVRCNVQIQFPGASAQQWMQHKKPPKDATHSVSAAIFIHYNWCLLNPNMKFIFNKLHRGLPDRQLCYHHLAENWHFLHEIEILLVQDVWISEMGEIYI